MNLILNYLYARYIVITASFFFGKIMFTVSLLCYSNMQYLFLMIFVRFYIRILFEHVSFRYVLDLPTPLSTFKDPVLPQPDEQTDVIITHVVSPHEIYAQKVTGCLCLYFLLPG